jgi:hypothetical protein
MLLGLLIGSFLLLPYSQDIGPNAVRMGEVISNRRMDLLKRQRGIAEGDFLGARAGFDHGAGHPFLFLDDVKAPHCRKNNGFKDLGNYAEWPKVAGAVITALAPSW